MRLLLMQEVLQDTSLVTLRPVPIDQIEALRRDSRFEYEMNLEPASSWWDRIWDYFWDLLIGRFLDEAVQPIWEYLIYAFITVVILYACYRLLGMRYSGLGYKRSEKAKPVTDLDLSPEVNDLEWERRIRDAIDSGAFREAVRLYFLKALRYLAREEMIVWQKYKTNRAYGEELEAYGRAGPFRKLSHIFEHTWYGHFEVNRFLLEEVQQQVETLMRQPEVVRKREQE